MCVCMWVCAYIYKTATINDCICIQVIANEMQHNNIHTTAYVTVYVCRYVVTNEMYVSDRGNIEDVRTQLQLKLIAARVSSIEP